MEDSLLLVLLYFLVYGWVIVWPAARWWMHLPPNRIVVLKRIFLVSLGLSVIVHLYVWHLFNSGNRDWWIATGLIHFIGYGAWFANIVAVINLWANGKASKK